MYYLCWIFKKNINFVSQIYIVTKYEYPRHIDVPILPEPKQLGYNYFGYRLETASVTSTESVRDLSYKQRKCVYKDELELDITNIYSYEACITQCKYKAAMETCNCFLPGFYNTGKHLSDLGLDSYRQR